MDYIKVPVICMEAILALADAERGRLLKAVLEYSATRSATEPCGSERGLYLVLKSQIDMDDRELESEREKQRSKKRKQRILPAEPPQKCEGTLGDTRGHEGTQGDIGGHWGTLGDTPSSPLPSPPIPPLSITSSSPKEKPPKGGKKKVPFSPPSLEEVKAYCEERNNGIDPEAFIAYYQANGWVQGKTCKPITDWKACVITWERSKRKEENQKQENPTVCSKSHRKFKTVEINGRLVDVEVEDDG